MNVFGIGLPEMALILVIALLVFGPKKLPEIGRSLGKAIRGFQEASREFESEFKREAEQIEQAVRTPTLPESREATSQETATAESNNHTTTSSQQS
ncbi:MAG TPA: TatA/E family twin arginine-targeting protein translocase [Waterburya sp.]|jgi:sec-independent protein translocase protein TatA